MHNPRSMCPEHFEVSEQIPSDGTTLLWLGMLRGQGMEGTKVRLKTSEVLSSLLCRYTILTYAELLYSIGDFEASRKCGAPVLVMTMTST